MNRLKTIGFLLSMWTLVGVMNAHAAGAYYSDVPHYDQNWFDGDGNGDPTDDGGGDCLPTAGTMLVAWHDSHGWPRMVWDGTNNYADNPVGVRNTYDKVLQGLGGFGSWDQLWDRLFHTFGDGLASGAQLLDAGATWWTDDDDFTSWSDMKGQIDNYAPLFLGIYSSADFYWGTLTDGYPISGDSVGGHAVCMLGYSEGEYKVNATARWIILDMGWFWESPAWMNYDAAGDLYTVEVRAQGTPAMPPSQPTSPTPGNNSSAVSRMIDLSWVNGGDATSYNVYLGTANPPGEAQFKGNQSSTTYDPGTLAYNTTYYWRIDAMSATGPTAGNVWRFTTESVSGSEVTLTSVADTMVMQNARDMVVGTWDSMSAANFWTNNRAYVRFNLSSIPAGSTVNSAELRFYVSSYYNPDGGTVDLFQLYSSFTENTTWNTQPTYAPTVGTSDPGGANITWSWPSSSFPYLKTLVQDWVNGSQQNYGLVLVADSLVSAARGGGEIAVRTREWGTSSQRPKLVVNYTPPPIGTLTVYINPADVRNQGSQWKLTSGPDTTYHNSGDTISDLLTGDYTLYFKSMAGWTRPSSHNTTITITAGANNCTDTYGFDVSAPTGVSASDGAYTDKTRILWNSSSGATEYEVWRNTVDSSGSSSRIGDHITGTSYNDFSVTEGLTYYYWVKAKNSAGTTGFSAGDTGYRALPPPSGVSASDNAFAGMIRVTWDAVAGATGYEVWRNTINDSSSATKVSSLDSIATTFDDRRILPPNNRYWYWVKSRTLAGAGGFSAGDEGISVPNNVAVWGQADQASVPAGLSNAVAVAGGYSHSLALCADGTVTAWGDGRYGQTNVPAGLSNVVAVAAGYNHCLALRADRSLIAWGWNGNGQIDVPPNLSNVVAIAAGGDHSLALRADGTVSAWGFNNSGQASVPARLSNVVAIAAGGSHSLALRTDGSVVAWGWNGLGQASVPTELSNAVAVAAYYHSLALRADGTVAAWGRNDLGQASVPAGLSNVVAIAGGYNHSLALRTDGTVTAWGSNESGQIGIPVDVSNVVAIAAGETHSLAVIGVGRPFLTPMVNQIDAQLGAPVFLMAHPTGERPMSCQWQKDGVPLDGLTNVLLTLTGTNVNQSGNYRCIVTNTQGLTTGESVHVAFSPLAISVPPQSGSAFLGQRFTLSVAVSGAEPLRYQWEKDGLPISTAMSSTFVVPSAQFGDAGSYRVVVSNQYGCATSSLAQISIVNVAVWGQVDQASVPAGLSNAVAVAGGYSHSLALRADGTVAAWGSNGYGQTDVPVELSNVVTIVAGYFHSLALRTDGTVAAWGWPGQWSVPMDLSNVVAVAGGIVHSLALQANGTVVAWGDNEYGQTDVPEGLNNVVAIAAGNHSLALRADGTVVAWGDNECGETDVPGDLSNVVAVAAGYLHSLALRADGTVVAWGDNFAGITSVPMSLSNVVAIAGGAYHSLALRADGSITAWGWNHFGETVIPAGLSNVVAVASGYAHGMSTIGVGRPFLTPMVHHINAQLGVPVFLMAHPAGERPMSCQWQKDGVLLDGLTNVLLTWTGTNVNQSGDYRCIVTNTQGVTTGASVHVKCAAPIELTTMTLDAGMEMLPYNVQLGATNGFPPYTWRMVGQLPAGLFWSSGGFISGTPTQAGSTLVSVTVVDSLGYSTNMDFEVAIAPNPNTRPVIYSTFPVTGSVAIVEGTSMGFRVNSYDPEGVDLTYSWTWDGLGVGGNQSKFTNTVTWEAIGTHTLRCYVSDGLWTNTIFSQWDVTVVDLPIEITTPSLPAGMEMVPYSATLQATNGVPPYSWRAQPHLLAWGANWSGQTDVPVDVAEVVAVAAGVSHNIALAKDGTVVEWGSNWSDQDHVLLGLCDVKQIAAGGYHSLALKTDGSVVAWGANWDGQIDVPAGLSGVAAIAGGESHSMALKADGTVVVWGYNPDGRTDVPPGLSNVVAIAAGAYNSLALKSDGTVVMWGDNGWGNVPPNLSNVVAIAGGFGHSLALKNDGAVVAWGADWIGQTTVPAGLSNVTAIAAGAYHSLALKTDGTMVAWGADWDGQTAVPDGLTEVVAIAGGYAHSLALRSMKTQMPAGLSCSLSGIVSGVPTLASTSIVTFVVQDSLGTITNKALQIVIAPNPNTRPVIYNTVPATGSIIMGEATSKVFRVYAYDPEDVDLTYLWTLDGLPVGANSSRHTNTTAWGDAGVHTLRCYASDDLWLNIVYAQWTITVLDDNDGDGMPNWQEIDLGRNPNDPNDAGAPSSLSGTIRGARIGLPGAYVELRGIGGTLYNATRTDGAGSYTIDGILPGNYRVKAGAEHFADEWYNNATHRTGAVPYSVSANTIIGGFDFDLEAGQNPALVEVTSDPAGAAIYLDFQATTNVTPSVLDVGEVGDWDSSGNRMAPHIVTVRKDGRPRPVPMTVEAREAETVSMHFDMTSDATGAVSIITVPDGATVFVDYADSSEGVTPVTIGNLAPGSHVVMLKKPEFLQPRPIVVSVEEGITSEVTIPLTDNTASTRLIAYVHSLPPNATIYVDYLPTTNVTDAVIDWMDPASHSGFGASHALWVGASHTIMLRKNGSLPTAPRYVSDQTNDTQMILVHLITDTVTSMDDDRDGVPDQWEDAYRLRELAPSQHGENDDPDGDGATNYQEMRAGTNPLDKKSSLTVSEVDLSKLGQTGMVTFTFETVPGRTYIVQCTDELKNDWTNLSGFIVATDYQTVFTSQIPEGTLHQFYRLIVLSP